jgi:hypothetical protein
MSKKVKCPKCGGGFMPTMEAFSIGKAECPACQASIPLTGAQASDALAAVGTLARGRFATGAPVLLEAQTAGDAFDIQWMPPGEQEPVVTVSEEPRELKFTVKEAHARAFGAMLQRLRNRAAAGEGDLPFIDFNHDDGAASGRPEEMYWGGDDPKKGGIRMRGKWTASGKAAVSGDAPEFTRFSPEWYFDDNDEPLAIGVNLGGLVNRAAFKTIASVKAGAANQQTKTKMTDQEIQSAIINGLTAGLKPFETRIAALETATAKGAEIVQGLVAKAMEPVTQELKAIKEGDLNNRKAQAKAAVKLHIDRGAIAPEEKLPSGKLVSDYYEEQYLANAADAEASLKKLPGRNLSRVIHGAGNGGTATASAPDLLPQENAIIAGARKLRESKRPLRVMPRRSKRSCAHPKASPSTAIFTTSAWSRPKPRAADLSTNRNRSTKTLCRDHSSQSFRNTPTRKPLPAPWSARNPIRSKSSMPMRRPSNCLMPASTSGPFTNGSKARTATWCTPAARFANALPVAANSGDKCCGIAVSPKTIAQNDIVSFIQTDCVMP